MSTSTVYDVRVRYALDDKVSRGANQMASAMDRTAKSGAGMNRMFALMAGGGLFMAGKRFLVDFNSEIDQMKIGMTTIMNMQLKTPWAQARKEADGLFKTFQELAKKSPATTRDFMVMANAITPVIASMGGGVDQIEKLTQGAVIAGIATGTRADVAALDIKQMLMGNVTERDMMANQLLAAAGIKKDDWNDNEKFSSAQRGAAVEKMLTHPALQKAADDFGNSFAGQVSTFKDQLEITLGQVGLPLVKAMGEEIKRWNKWIERNPQTIQKIVGTLGKGLKSTFEFIKGTVGWLVDNRDTIFSVAKIFVAFKGAQLATGVFASFVGGLKNLGNNFNRAAGVFAGGAGAVGGKFTTLVSVLSGAGGVIPVFAALSAVGLDLWSRMTALGREEDKARTVRGEFSTAKFNALAQKTRKSFDLEEQLETMLDKRRASGDWTTPLPGEDFVKTQLEEARADMRDPTKMAPLVREMSDIMAATGSGDLANLSPDALQKRLRAGLPKQTFDSIYGDGGGKQLANDIAVIFDQLGKLTSEQLLATQKLAFPERFGIGTEGANDSPTTGWSGGSTDTPTVNVTVHTIEVQSEDPDRFVFGLAKSALKAARNPTQAAGAFGGDY